MTEDQGEHIAFVVVVVDTAEEGDQAAVAPGGTGDVGQRRVARSVAHIGVFPLVGPEDAAVASTDIFAEAAMFEGVTDQGVEVVAVAEGEHVVDGVFPRPVPAGACALADVVHVGEGVVGQFIGEAVLTVGVRTHLVVELALPDQALDGLDAEVGRHVEAVVVAFVVTAGRVDHGGDRVAGVRVEVPDTALAQPVVLGVAAVGLVNGNQRVGRKHGEDIVPVVVAGTDTALRAGGEGQVLTEGDDVEVALAPEHVVRVDTGRQTLVVGSYGLAEDTFLVGVAHTHRELGDVRTTDDVDGVVRVGRIRVADRLKPVGSHEGTVLDAVVEGRIQGVDPVDGVFAHIEVHLVLDVHVLPGIQELGHLLDVLHAVEAVVGDGDLAALALLGGNQDDAVRTTGTVDGAGSSVLEDVDAFNVGRVECVDVAARHTVDYIQRSIGTGGTHTADVDVVAGTRLTIGAHDAHAGRGGLHGSEGAGGVELGQLFTLDLDGGAGHELLLLDAVTDHDRFFEKLGIFLKEHFENRAVSDRDHLSLVTDGRNLDRRAGLDVQNEITLHVCRGTILGAAFNDTRTDHGAVGVGDRTGDPDGLRHGGHAQEQQCQGSKKLAFHGLKNVGNKIVMCC